MLALSRGVNQRGAKSGAANQRRGGDKKVIAAASKPKMSVLPMRALVGAARVFETGIVNYGHGNFMEAASDDKPWQRYYDAFLRHYLGIQTLGGVIDEESLASADPESLLPEIDHMICNLLMLRSIAIKLGVLPEDPAT